MTKSERKYYIFMSCMCEMAKQIKENKGLLSKSRQSLNRIIEYTDKEINDVDLENISCSDKRSFNAVRDGLRSAKNQVETMSMAAFVSAAMAIADDYSRSLPVSAHKQRNKAKETERLYFTLYKHFDKDLCDFDSMNHGEQIANEFSGIVSTAM